MFFKRNRSQMSISEFLANPARPVLIDIRGCAESDPAIPGSESFYLLDIEENIPAFEHKYLSLTTTRPMLLYCSKGEGSRFLLDQFSGKFEVRSLEGGMINYLTTISCLLHEHPYEDSRKRTETMAKILTALTSRDTDPATFDKIIDRLLRCSTNPKFRKLLR